MSDRSKTLLDPQAVSIYARRLLRMYSTTEDGHSSEDREAGAKIEGGCDQIYFINASENCFAGTMPDDEEMPGLHNAVNLFMQRKGLEPEQISRQSSQHANIHNDRDEWWPIEANTNSLERHAELIDPPMRPELPTVLAVARSNEPQAEPSATETFECSAANPATLLSDWETAERKRGIKAAQWTATTELSIAASKNQACKQAWQKDLVLRQFIREIQRKLQDNHVFFLQILPPGAIMKTSSCAHPFCQATKGKRLGANPSGTVLGSYRLSLEPVINLELATVPEMPIDRGEKPSITVRKLRRTHSLHIGAHGVQRFCLTCVEDLFCGKDLLGSVPATGCNSQKAKTVDATNARTASHRNSGSGARPIVIFWRRPKSPDDTARRLQNLGPLNSTGELAAPNTRVRSLKLILNPPNYTNGHTQTQPLPQRSATAYTSRTAASESTVVPQLVRCMAATTTTNGQRKPQRLAASKPTRGLGCCTEGKGKGASNLDASPGDIKTSPRKRNLKTSSPSSSTSQALRDISPPPAVFGPFCTSSTPHINGLTPFHQLSSFIHPETRQHSSGYLTLSICQIVALEKWKSEIDKALMLRHPENRKFMERNGLLYNYPEAPRGIQEENEQEDSRAYFDDEGEATEEEDTRAYFDDAELATDVEEEKVEEEEEEEGDQELDIRHHGYPLHGAWIRPSEGPIRGVMEEGGKIVELSAKEVKGQKLSAVMRLVDGRVKEELRAMGKEWDREWRKRSGRRG